MTTTTLRAATLSIESGVATFTHARPATRNALSSALREDYEDMLDAVAAHGGVQALVLAAEGGSFCAGGDIGEMRARVGQADPALNSPAATVARVRRANGWLGRLRELDAVVIAAVDGPAYGAGFSLALHADFILASERASFCMSFARLGLVPDFGATYLLTRQSGIQAARDLMLTGRRIDARQARDMGLVQRIWSSDALLPAAQRAARAVCAASPQAMAYTKHLLNRSLDEDYAGVAEVEAYAQASTMASDYHQEAIRAFLAKEPVRYDWERDCADWSGESDRRPPVSKEGGLQ